MLNHLNIIQYCIKVQTVYSVKPRLCPMLDIGLAGSRGKCLALGMRPGNNASLLSVFERYSRLFYHTNVVRIVTLRKN